MTVEKARSIGAFALAILGASAAMVQAGLLFVRGEAICLSDGCRVVEGLSRVPPLFINLAGGCFFLAAAVLTWRAVKSKPARRLRGFLLLAGIAAEGVLFGYQNFVAKTFCHWCLGVLALVVLLNLLAGWRQACRAAAVFVAVLAAFSVLRFGVVQPTGGGRGLDSGTWGVTRCAAPAKQLYLIFSSTCPHCAEVIRTLESCNSCTLHFNPVDQVDGLVLPGVERLASWDPAVNHGLLALLGIKEVPVLLVPSPEGFSVIRGGERILAYVRAECFRAAPLLNVDPSRSLDDGSLSIFREEEGSCDVTVECPPEEQSKP